MRQRQHLNTDSIQEAAVPKKMSTQHRLARRLRRTALFAVVRGAATTLGSAAAAGTLWWLGHHL
jgi:hypothetical protein